jgi:hypothetical protein
MATSIRTIGTKGRKTLKVSPKITAEERRQLAQLATIFDQWDNELAAIADRLDTVHSLMQDNIREVQEAKDILRNSNQFALSK